MGDRELGRRASEIAAQVAAATAGSRNEATLRHEIESILERHCRALVPALYALLAVVLTWPLARHLTTHLPGSYTWAFDEYTFVWNTWWLRYSLLNLGQNPLATDYIFYPLGISLVLYTYNILNALIALPLQAFLPLPAISNLTFLVTTALSGYGTYLLVRYILSTSHSNSRSTNPQPAAFLSGLIYAFGSYRMVYAAIGHYDMWSTAWIPLYALFLLKTLREPGRRNPILAGLFLTLSMLNEMIFGVFLGMLTVILVIGHRPLGIGDWELGKRLAVLGLVAGVLYAPLGVPILREMVGGYELTGWGDAEKLSVDLLGLVTPTALHPWGGDWAETLRRTREGTARFRDVNTVFLGWTGLTLALIGAVRYRRRLAAWIAAFITFALFSLGPLLQINGRSLFDLDGLKTTVPLPFILLHYIPIVKANRVPNRFSVVLMLALAVLAGFGAFWLLGQPARSKERPSEGRRLPSAIRYPLTALLAVLLLFEHLSIPLPLTDARIPEVYGQVAAAPGDFAILQLPLGWRNSFGVQGAESTQTQYYQTFHHKRLLSGNISRNPPFKFDYFRRVPILDSLITIQTYGQVDDARRAADRATAAEFVRFYDIRYVVVAPGVAGRPPYVDTRDAAVAYMEEVLPLEKVYDRDGWLLYRVDRQPLPSSLTVDVGAAEPLTAMALGEGWAGAEEIQGRSASWAVEQKARLFLPAVGGTAYRLTLTALPFDYPGAAAQEVTPILNGHRLEPRTLTPGWGDYAWDVPAEVLRPGLNDLRLAFARLDAPAEVLPGNGVIGTTGVQAPVAVEVNSGGPEGFAYITIGEGEGAVDGSLHGPGYNVAVVDTRGKVRERRTFADPADLADFIAGVEEGQIVIVALQGEAAAHLNDDALAALRSIGGQADPRREQGSSHAIIGVKGAAPGTALEAAGPGNGWLRVAPDRRTLAVALDAVRWEQRGEGNLP